MLLPYLLKVSLLLAALTLGYRWLIQYETFSQLNRALLWLNVAAAWSLPFIPLAGWGPVEVQQEFHHTLPELANTLPTVASAITTVSIKPSPTGTPGTPSWELADWLLLVYLIGAGIMLVRFLYQLGGLLRTLWRHPAERLENGVRLIQDESTPSPFSFFHWVVCNPEKHTPTELQHILLHESEHAHKGHSVDLLLAESQRILLWFNPFAWLHQRLVQENLEYLADRAVLNHGFKKKHYQLSMLKTVLRTNESPLTNSFAQSLLKKRIKMMNRKPSNYWVAGKYAFLLATLYLSSAFVAPYKSEIVAATPTPMQPVMSMLVAEPMHKVPLPKASAKEKVVEPIGQEVKVPLSNTASTTKSKWTQVKDGTLFWAIPATATWEDINLIKADVKKFGSEMKINELKYDPMQQFITSITIYIKSKGTSGTGNGSGDDAYSPAKGYSGYVGETGSGMGQLPPEPLLSRYNQSYQQALVLKKAHKNDYLEDELNRRLYQENGGMSGSSYSNKSFDDQYAQKSFEKEGVGKSEDNKLMLGEMNKNAEFYLNAEPSTFEELNGITIDTIDKVVVKKASKTKKRYILVFTN